MSMQMASAMTEVFLCLRATVLEIFQHGTDAPPRAVRDVPPRAVAFVFRRSSAAGRSAI